jgi:long-chain acyl-CoA synthetase
MHVGSLLPAHALHRPEHLAIVCGDQRFTFRQFNERVNRLANALRALGVGKGDKIATLLPNCSALLETYWAAPKIGAVLVPLSPLTQEKALLPPLRDSDTRAVVASRAFAGALSSICKELPELDSPRVVLVGDPCPAESVGAFHNYDLLVEQSSPGAPPPVHNRDEDPYNIIYTSGTTGTPKGIVHTHYIRALYCLQFASSWRMTPESVVLHAGSIVFNGAFLTLMPAMYLGSTYILLKSFSPELLIETVERERVTHLMMVPSQIVALLNSPSFSPKALATLEMIGSVGAPLHMEHKEKLNRSLPGRFYELYGLTEGFITVLDKNHFATKPASVGMPLRFFDMRIVGEDGKNLPPHEVGEIVGRGPLLTPGYYKRPDLTAETIKEGWLYTGDMGYVDEDGFLFLAGRKKDMIISGGVNVFPADIEEVIVHHPAVQEVAVFGVPSEKWGETPLAAVILRKGAAANVDELRDWINERVDAKHQRVSKVVFLEDFPRTVAGKTLKRALRAPYWRD